MKFSVAVTLPIFAFASTVTVSKVPSRRLDASGFLQVGQDLFGTPASDFTSEVDYGEAVSLNYADGTRLVVGAPHHDFDASNTLSEESGAVFVYDLVGNTWNQTLSFHGDQGENLGDRLSMSADGSRLALRRYVAGAPDTVEVYDVSVSPPVQLGSALSCGSEGSTTALSSDGNRVAVSCEYFGANSGRVDIFDYDGTDWNRIGILASSVDLSLFGWCTGFDSTGNRLAISAPNYSFEGISRIGLVRLFDYDGTDWNQLGNDLLGTVLNQQFGFSMALSGNGESIAIGSPVSDGSGDQRGTVTVYTLVGDTMTPVGNVIEGQVDGDRFGRSTAISFDGQRVASASYLHDNQRGHVRLFELQGSIWGQIGGDIDGENEFDRFGFGVTSVTITSDGRRIASSAPRREDSFGQPTGQVLVLDEEIITDAPSQAPTGIIPTEEPSSVPSVTPTALLTSEPSVAPSQPPSLMPSQAPVTPLPTGALGKFDWDLNRTGEVVAIFNEATQDNEIELEYVVNLRPFIVSVFEADCSTPVTDDVINATGFVMPISSTHGNLTVSLDVKQDTVVGSSVWEDIVTGEGLISVCIRVDLVLDDGSDISVHFHETKLFITIGLTQGFSVLSVDLDRTRAKEESAVANVDYGIFACQCNAIFTCDDVVLVQGDDLWLCVFTNSSNIDIVSVESLDLIQNTLLVSPIVGAVENILTSVAIEPSRAVIRTQVISEFFAVEDPDDMVAQGVIALTFKNGTSPLAQTRQLEAEKRRLQGEGSSDFDVKVGLKAAGSPNSGASTLSTLFAPLAAMGALAWLI